MGDSTMLNFPNLFGMDAIAGPSAFSGILTPTYSIESVAGPAPAGTIAENLGD